MADKDPWADEPDRFDAADREWAAKWAAPKEEDPEVPGEGYKPTRATPGTIHDAYGDGMRAAGPHLGLGVQIAGSMLLFVGIGLLVDQWLGTTPWGVLVGAALGMVGIVLLVMRIAKE